MHNFIAEGITTLHRTSKGPPLNVNLYLIFRAVQRLVKATPTCTREYIQFLVSQGAWPHNTYCVILESSDRIGRWYGALQLRFRKTQQRNPFFVVVILLLHNRVSILCVFNDCLILVRLCDEIVSI